MNRNRRKDGKQELYNWQEEIARAGGNIECLKDPDYIYSHVKPRLISLERKGYLEDKIHVAFMDMAIIFAVAVTEKCHLLISKKYGEWLGLTETSLSECAKRNIEGKATIDLMATVLAEITSGSNQATSAYMPDIYILSNKEKFYGAQMILSETVLWKLWERLGDYYIIPSSVHELLVLKKNFLDADSLFTMNREINETVVDANDRLTTAIYQYSREGLSKVR